VIEHTNSNTKQQHKTATQNSHTPLVLIEQQWPFYKYSCTTDD